ncbi:HIT family protein [Frankia umida]|uniref:HIT family protein n=1 Tax=Frankia umida TaxID=573489 RepID=UPI00200F38BB|nr:HIT family protein [Frankia umida]
MDPKTRQCIFCAIVAGAAPAWITDQDDWTVSFLDISPAAPGHTLVVPRTHADDLWSISSEDAQKVMAAAHRVAGRLRDRLRPDGLSLTQANRAAAGQEVFHLHVHLVPRYVGDQVRRAGSAVQAGPEELAATWESLRSPADS